MRKFRNLLYGFGILIILVNVSIVSGKMQASEANPLPTKWEMFYHGPLDDVIYAIQETSDKGFVLAGTTNSYGNGDDDAWLLKTDKDGNALWNFTYGGSEEESFSSVFETSDHSFLLAGTTNSFGNGDNDFWVVKVDNNGNLQFNKTFGTSGNDQLAQMIKTSNGNYVLSGRYHNASKQFTADAWLIKINEDGDLLWNHTYGGIRYDVPQSVTELSTGGYAFATWTGNTATDPNQGDFMVIKVDENGIQQWNSTYGIVGGTDIPSKIIETSNGGVIVTGFSRYASSQKEQIVVVKFNSDGSQSWNKSFGGSKSDWGNLILKLKDGYLLCAHTVSYGPGNGDNILIKIDENGNQIFNQTNGQSQGDDFFWDMKPTSDGNFIFAGRSILSDGFRDGWLVKMESPTKASSPGFDFTPVLVCALLLIIVKKKNKKN